MTGTVSKKREVSLYHYVAQTLLLPYLKPASVPSIAPSYFHSARLGLPLRFLCIVCKSKMVVPSARSKSPILHFFVHRSASRCPSWFPPLTTISFFILSLQSLPCNQLCISATCSHRPAIPGKHTASIMLSTVLSVTEIEILSFVMSISQRKYVIFELFK